MGVYFVLVLILFLFRGLKIVYLCPKAKNKSSNKTEIFQERCVGTLRLLGRSKDLHHTELFHSPALQPHHSHSPCVCLSNFLTL